jgi:hypothetical protein
VAWERDGADPVGLLEIAGVADLNLLPAVTFRTPSMASARPKVSSTDIEGEEPRIRATTVR